MTTKLIATTTWPVTLAEAKLRLRIDGTDDDADLQMMIEAATDLAANMTRRSIAVCSWQVRLDAFPSEIRLLHPPILTVQSVKYIDPDGALQTLDPAAYSIDKDSEPGWLRPADGTTWPETKATANAVTIDYTAGWGTSCPSAVKQFILLQVGHMYRNREAASDRPLMVAPYGERLLDRWKLWEV